MSSRKRAAPGADPPIQPSPNMNNLQPIMDYSSYDMGNNGYNLQPFDNGMYENFGAPVPFMDVPQYGAVPGEPGQLVRRNPNQQLTTRGLQWPDENTAQTGGNPDSEDEAELNQRAMAAKSEAQARNRQIPPFIQKLSSFLDESKNTDLIRWSDDGRSFVVLDEEEFAKTLIPELFKHNNYASFVRQLNMYGFHKKVGLSDNSMKASENKRKTPSEYWNQYFRRGRPDLLYLIQKPKTVPTSKRKREDGRGEHSDEEKKPNMIQLGDNAAAAGAQNQDLATIPKQELVGLRNELLTLQRQQKLISGVIGQIKRQNDQLYQQASAFQAMHDRHESSINAILTFLATFYNRSLEGNGPLNMAEMFKNALGGQAQQPQGNIVEMPDLPNMDINAAMRNGSSVSQSRRKQPLLLPAPDAKPAASTTPVASMSTSNRMAHPRTQTATPQPRRPPAPRVSSVEDTGYIDGPSPMAPIKAESETPQTIGDTNDILSAINAANANSPAMANNLDFNSALEQLQNTDGTSSLTPQQQRQMLSMLGAGDGSSSAALRRSTDPSLPQQINQSHEQLEILERLQKEQDAKVAQLAERLGPLSPNGAVPGLHDAQNNGTPIQPPPDFNLDDFLNDTSGSQFEYDPNMPENPSYADLGIDGFGGAGSGDNHFTLGGANEDELADMDNGGGYFGSTASSSLKPGEHLSPHRRVESLTSRETTPGTTGTEEVSSATGTGNSPRKRRKTGDL